VSGRGSLEEGVTEENEWDPINIDRKELMIQISYGIFVYIFITLFIIFIEVNIRTVWVLFNIIIGYAILSNEKARKYYYNILKGFREAKVWAYAVLNLVLILSVVLIPALFISSSGGGDTSPNPFVSNYIFLLFLIPIVPLFADAETKIFQEWIIKGVHRNVLVKCKSCERKALPMERCDLCRAKQMESSAYGISSYMPAILLSGFIFALAHVILVGSILPMMLIIGGILLGILYVKDGAILVAKVHMLYNYLVIGLLIAGGLL
jgi:hypothetical protein